VWEIIGILEAGGNAEVAPVRDPDGREGVLKAPRDQRAEHVTLERFRREVATQRQLGDVAGVLPLLDSHLPEDPAGNDFAWLVTPLAVRLDEHLAGEPPRAAVAAVQGLATTLSEIHARGIAHGDIKPANLFWLDGCPMLGDLGLVAIPDTKTVAEEGRIPGAFGFIADEILMVPDQDAVRIDEWQGADVFALAKTLRVLAAQQPFPPQGHIASSDEASSLRRRLAISGAEALDDIIDRATCPAAVRLTVSGSAGELEAWHQEPVQLVVPESMNEALALVRPRWRASSASGTRGSIGIRPSAGQWGG
jgi:serine/threonine protein kinase